MTTRALESSFRLGTEGAVIRGLESYGEEGGGESWTEDYSDDSLAVATQWTSRGGFRFGVFDFSGTKKLAVCSDGAYEYVDWYFAKCSYGTALATGQAQTFRVEVEFIGTGSGLSLFARSSATASTYNGLQVEGNGNWIAINETGGSGFNGTFSVPSFNTPFEVELVVAADGSATATINGTPYTLANTGVFDRSGLYCGLQMGSGTKCRKFFFGDP